MKKKENRTNNAHEALKENDDDEKCEDKTEVEIEGSKLIEETKRKKKNENKIKKVVINNVEKYILGLNLM